MPSFSDAPSAQHLAASLSDRFARLAVVSSELVGARDIAAVIEVVTQHMTDAADAVGGSLSLLVDEDTLALVGISGSTEGLTSRWATYPLVDRNPAADAVRSGRPVVLVGRTGIESAYPGLELVPGGERSLVVLPLGGAEGPIGAVTLSFDSARDVDAAEMQFLALLTNTCAQAVERIRARDAAQDREAKLRFLAEASVQLASDLDYETTLKQVADLAVPVFADWCSIALLEDGELRTLSVAHADPATEPLVEELQRRYPPRPRPTGPYEVLRTGVSELVPQISDSILAEATDDAEHLALVQSLGLRSALTVALKVRDRVLGVITWVAGETGRRFTAADVEFGEDLARRAAVAIDNAQLHSQLRDVALRLQQAVLPASLPSPAGWEIGVDYRPAGRTGAGGDFYDVLVLDDQRIAFFVGDVMGRGVQAAAVMAQMRSALRTLVAVDPEPATVSERLDHVFERLRLDQLVTMVYGLIDPACSSIEVVNAGHPAPLVLCRSGEVRELSTDQTLILGAGGGPRSVGRFPLDVGDTLLVFTDGLVERRGEDLQDGLERLVTELLERQDLPLAASLPTVVDVVRDPMRDDDVALLGLRRAQG